MGVNSTIRTLRTVIALVAGLALTLTACSGDDDTVSTTTPTTEASTGGTQPGGIPAMQPSSIAFDAQASDGTTITVASVDLPAAGFIAVHSDGGGSPGAVIGTSRLLPPGETFDIVVELDTPLTADTTLFPMVHIDTNGNGAYEFGSVDGVDGPGLTADGEVAVVSAAVTVNGGSGTETDEGAAPASGDTITIANFAFDGVTEVALGTTVTVTNTDASPHTWSSEDGTFDSGSISPGDTFEFTFDTAGEFAYFCNFHPSMTGTITVTG